MVSTNQIASFFEFQTITMHVISALNLLSHKNYIIK